MAQLCGNLPSRHARGAHMASDGVAQAVGIDLIVKAAGGAKIAPIGSAQPYQAFAIGGGGVFMRQRLAQPDLALAGGPGGLAKARLDEDQKGGRDAWDGRSAFPGVLEPPGQRHELQLSENLISPGVCQRKFGRLHLAHRVQDIDGRSDARFAAAFNTGQRLARGFNATLQGADLGARRQDAGHSVRSRALQDALHLMYAKTSRVRARVLAVALKPRRRRYRAASKR